MLLSQVQFTSQNFTVEASASLKMTNIADKGKNA